MVKLKIDPEFRDKIPALTKEEFEQLKENILADGEVIEPIVTWHDTIVDGHNRWRIICENWEKLKDKYRIKEMDFPDKWAAFAWMFKNQLGRRNIQAKDRDLLIDGLMEARKKSHGGDRRSEIFSNDQSGLLKSEENGSTRRAVAKELGVGEGTVQRAQELGNGLRELEKVSPEAAKIYRTTANEVPRSVIRDIPKMEKETVEKIAEAIIEGKPIQKEKPKPTGWTKADRESRSLTESIVSDMYNPDSVPEYTLEFLIEDIQINARNYVNLLRNTLLDRSTLLTPANKPVVAEAIDKFVIQEIIKLKERIEK